MSHRWWALCLCMCLSFILYGASWTSKTTSAQESIKCNLQTEVELANTPIQIGTSISMTFAFTDNCVASSTLPSLIAGIAPEFTLLEYNNTTLEQPLPIGAPLRWNWPALDAHQSLTLTLQANQCGQLSPVEYAYLEQPNQAPSLLTLPLILVTGCESNQDNVRFYLTPARLDMRRGEVRKVELHMQTSNKAVDGVELKLRFDPTYVQVVNAQGILAKQIESSATFLSVLLNRVDNTTGEILFAAGQVSSDISVGDTLLATLYLRASSDTSTSLQQTLLPVTTKQYIAYTSDPPIDQDILLLPTDNSGLVKQLTHNLVNDAQPTWSPDGSRIAFTSEIDGNAEIFVMNADGSNVNQITHSGVYKSNPTWSPNGTYILYRSGTGEESKFYVIGENQTEPMLLIGDAESIYDASWLPDSLNILYTDQGGDSNKDYIININDPNPTELPIHGLWSPDGSRVAYTITDDEHNDLFIMLADGSEQIQLTPESLPSIYDITWSPDGQLLTFNDGANLYEVNIDAAQPFIIADNIVGKDNVAVWSPDGQQIAYRGATSTDQGASDEIYIINADGSNKRQLTQNGIDKSALYWSPDSKRIAFSQESERNGYEIFVAAQDYSEPQLLTTAILICNYEPTLQWSRDGMYIITACNVPDNPGIVVTDILGNNKTEMATGQMLLAPPIWLQDGRNLLFSSTRNFLDNYTFPTSGLYQLDLYGQQFTTVTQYAYLPLMLTISPKSKKLAFVGLDLSTRSNGTNTRIYTQQTDGLQLTPLTPLRDNSISILPVWSFDSHQIAFLDSQNLSGFDPTFKLKVMNADGTGMRQIADSVLGVSPAWWPNGDRIAFASFKEQEQSTANVVIMGADGTNTISTNLTNTMITALGWSPDGEKLAFTTIQVEGEAKVGLIVINKDGTFNLPPIDVGVTDIHNRGGTFTVPHLEWSSDGKKVVFDVNNAYGSSEIYLVDTYSKVVSLLASNARSPSWQPVVVSPFSPEPKADISYDVRMGLQWSALHFDPAIPPKASAQGQTLQVNATDAYIRSGYGLHLYGQLTWQGRTPPPDESWINELTVSLLDADKNELAYSFNTQTDAMGRFAIGPISTGTYQASVKGYHTLSSPWIKFDTSEVATEVDFGELLEGDANNDNRLDQADIDLLQSVFGQTCGSAQYQPQADFNGDCTIDITDLSWLNKNQQIAVTQPAPPTAVPTSVSVTAVVTDAPTEPLTTTTTVTLTVAATPTAEAPPLLVTSTLTSSVLTQVSGVTIVRTSPTNGEDEVAVTRETIIEFNAPLDPTTLAADAFTAEFGGKALPARLHVSPDNKIVTLFYQEPLPASARIRVVIRGDAIKDDSGKVLDVDSDGQPGGTATVAFDTLGVSRIPGTEVWGYVFDSYNKKPDGSDLPVVGATIRVDGFPEANTVTDDNGYFILKDMPAPIFFVHIDGTTAINAPPGRVYPSVGKPFHSVAGQSMQLVMDGTPFHIYLPPMAQGDIQALSPDKPTEISFGSAGKAELAAMHPEIDPTLWERTIVTFPVDSAIDEAGNVATEGIIIPVPPDRIPAPLPPDLDLPLVISVQSPGATNFDVPAPVCFPNLPDPDTGQLLLAGDKSALWSFNHDTGRWEMGGPMTVSADGQMVCTDPGVGIRAPGWHGTQPGSTVAAKLNKLLDKIPNKNCLAVISNISSIVSSAALLSPQVSVPFQIAAGLAGIFSDITSMLQAEESSELVGPGLIDIPTNSLTILGAIAVKKGWDEPKEPFFGLPIYRPTPPGSTVLYPDPKYKPLWNKFLGKASTISSIIGIGYNAYDLYNNINTCLSGDSGVIKKVSGLAAVVPQITNNSSKDIDAYLQTVDTNSQPLLEGLSNILGEAIKPLVPTDRDIYLIYDEGHLIGYEADGSPYINPNTGQQFNIEINQLVDQRYLKDTEFRNANLTLLQTGLQNLSNAIQPNNSLANQFETTVQSVMEQGQELANNFAVTGVRTPAYYVVVNTQTHAILNRGKTSDSGQISFIAPDNVPIEIQVFDPDSLGYSVTTLNTPQAGNAANITISIVALDDTIDDDADGLGMASEFVIGTDPAIPDTDKDGLNDGIEIQQHTDPLSGLAVTTGVIASADTPGTAVDLCVTNEYIVVADKKAGISVFNVFNGLAPTIIAQIPTPGSAESIACEGSRVMVADSKVGYLWLDLADPANPQIIRQGSIEDDKRKTRILWKDLDEAIKANLSSTPIYGSIFLTDTTYLLKSNEETAYLLGTNDIAVAGDELYLLTDDELLIYSIQSGERLGSIEIEGRAAPITNRRRLFVGNDLAYVGYFEGFSIVDVSNPTAPKLIGQPPATQAAIHDLAVTGTGELLAVTSFAGEDTLAVSQYDITDSSVVTNFITSFETTGTPRSIALHEGFAYVADGEAGIHAVNYLAYDSQGLTPTITLDTNFITGTVVEGGQVRVSAVVSDDVQIKNVTFYVDGQVVAVDGAFPFEYRFTAPLLRDRQAFTVRAQATDTGGNSASTDETTVTITPDTIPPTVTIVEPSKGDTFVLRGKTIPIRVSASDNVKVTEMIFKVDDVPVMATHLLFDLYEIPIPATAGEPVISVTAKDAAGLTSDSRPVRIVTTDLNYNQVVQGTINFAGDTDTFPFEGQGGDRIDVVVSFPNYQYLFLYLSNAKGEIVTSCTERVGYRCEIPDFALPESGLYTITIAGDERIETTYNLSLSQLGINVQPITYGQSIEGKITIPGERDDFIFEGQVGEQIDAIVSFPGNEYLFLHLVGPNGEVVSSCTDAGSYVCELANITLPASGIYTITVDGAGTVVTKYMLSLSQLGIDVQPIDYGQSVEGKIAVPGERDYFTFMGQRKDRINVIVSYPSGYMFLALTDSFGEVVASCTGIDSYNCELADVTLPESGVYTITVDGYNAITTKYMLSLSQLGIDVSSVNYGQSVEGKIAVPGERDDFTFTGQRQEIINVIVVYSDYDHYLFLYLKDSFGEVVASCTEISSDACELAVTLPESGVYTITVDGNRAVTTDYILSLSQLRTDVQPIGYGQSVNSKITVPGERDYFTFEGQLEERVNVVVAFPRDQSMLLYLLDANKEVIASCTQTRSLDCSLTDVSLPKTGTYTIIVDGFKAITGDYTLTLSLAQ